MAVRQPTEIDLERVDALIAQEEAALEPEPRPRSPTAPPPSATRRGVASSWQDSPPHAIFVDHDAGSRLWDIDGNEYVDFHLGYGAMVMGHAHPKIVEVIQKQAALGTLAQPTKDLDAVGENLVERFGLPLWRFCNSGTEATLEATRLMRANTGRDIIKIRGQLSRPHPRLADVLGSNRTPT